MNIRVTTILIVSAILISAFSATVSAAPPSASSLATTTNYCGYIYSPGYWKNWDNHYTAEEFQNLIDNTGHFAGLTPAEAVVILKNNRDQFLRHLLSAELNGALNSRFTSGVYSYGSLTNIKVQDLYELAAASYPDHIDNDLLSAVKYVGSDGEGASDSSCRIQAEIY